MVQNSLRKLFGLHPGEGVKASLFCLIALLWGIGGYGTLTLSEGMLLQNVGAAILPYTYLFVALSFFTLSTLLIYALNHISVKNILLLVLAGTVLAQLIFYVLYPYYLHSSSYWVAYKVYGWITPVSIYICFWAFVDQYFDLQSGKRFFALFNAMLFLGDALGGASISYGIEFLKIKGLFLLYPSLILASAFCVVGLSRRLKVPADDLQINADSKSSLSFKSLLKTAISSRYTLALLIFYFSMQMLAIVTEFTYMEQFEISVKSTHDENYLVQFMGNLGMWVSLLNMFFGMFVYSRVVRKLGVNNIILIAPACFMALFLFWIGTPALSIAIFGVVAREGMIYSLDDNNLNLLLAGVPARIKNQVRFGVESFFEPAGMLISAFMLLFFQNQSKLIGILLASITLIFVFVLRSYYTKAIFNNLVSSHLRVKQRAMDWFTQLSAKEHKKAEFVMLYGLKQQGESEQMLAFEHLLNLNNKNHLPRLINHINGLSLPAKLKALELFGQSPWVKEDALIKKLKWWARTSAHPAFTSALHLYFARHGLLQPEEVIRDLDSSKLTERAASIIALKTASEEHPTYAALATQKLRLMLDSDEIEQIVMALKIIGIENNKDHAEVLLPYLRHSSRIVSLEAANALTRLANKRLPLNCNELIKQLTLVTDQQIRDSILNAINSCFSFAEVKPLIQESASLRQTEKIKIAEIITNSGTKSVPILLAFVNDWTMKDQDRLLAAKIAIKIDPMALRASIVKIVKRDLGRAYFYYYHAHTIQKQIPEQNLYMLENALTSSFEIILNSIIQMLTLNGGIQESEIMARSLKSDHPKIRATAYETLEKVTPTALFALLEPFFNDQVSVEKRAELYLKQGGMPLPLTQLLRALLNSANPTDQIIALSLKAKLKVPGWKEAAHEKVSSKEQWFSNFAKEVLNAP